MARSRSSVLLEAISNFYHIKILGEDINQLLEKYGDDYIDKLKPLLYADSNSITGVIRFHPLQLIANRPFRTLNFNDRPFILVNFDWFNFNQYDKIFFTTRKDISENIASNFVATKLQKFTYKWPEKVNPNIGPFTFEQQDHFHVRDYHRSVYIIEQLKDYLTGQGIEWTELDYNEIPKYIRNNYPGVKVSHVETHYQYDKIISNYSDIVKIYNQTTLH